VKAALAVLLVLPAIAQADATRRYVVVDGDSCLGIAYRELGDASQLEALHAANPQLGKLPHKLVAGQIINLPGTGAVAADAHLRSLRGRVEVLPAGTERWDSGTTNQELFRTWRVGTRAKATAKVQFVDLTTIDMREDTVVMIFGPTAGTRSTLRTQLDRGVLRTRLAALDKKIVVDTPAGKAELGTGSALVDVDTTKETRLANHGGKPAKLSNARGKVELQAGYGSRVLVDKPPSPPIKLLPPPRWESAGELALAWEGDPITLRGRWMPVPGAVKYRLEIARSTTPLEVESQVEVASTITRLEATGLPVASYLVTVASVDRDGLEGPPSTPLLIQAGEVPRPRARTGSVFEPPQGLRCARGGAPPAAEAPPTILVREHETELARVTCASPTGHSTLELAIPAPRIEWPSDRRRLKRGELSVVEIGLREIDPAHLQTIARGATITRRSLDGDRLRLELVAPVAGTTNVRFVIDGVEIAIEELTIVEPGDHPTGSFVTAGRRWRWGLGAYGGATFARDNESSVFGAELWLAPRPWLAPYLGVAKLADDREGTIRTGVRTAFTRTWNPVARAGLVIVGSERLAGEVGGGVELIRGMFGLRAEAQLVGNRSDVFVQGVIGLTISR
jgi:hypothetical protein